MMSLETALLTVTVGVSVFLLGQIILVLFVERIRIQARTIEEISESLVIYAREYLNPSQPSESLSSERKEQIQDAADNLRKLSARLRSTAVTLRYYALFERFGLVLPKNRIIKASGSLMGLSNSIPPTQNMLQDASRFRNEIEESLDIKIPEI